MTPEEQVRLEPRQVVLDLVLAYCATMPTFGHAAVLHGSLVFAACNHRGQYVHMSLPVHFDGEPFGGDESRPPHWVLRQLGPTVWKLSPSVLDAQIHAYITIVNVPEGAWTSGGVVTIVDRIAQLREAVSSRVPGHGLSPTEAKRVYDEVRQLADAIERDAGAERAAMRAIVAALFPKEPDAEPPLGDMLMEIEGLRLTSATAPRPGRAIIDRDALVAQLRETAAKYDGDGQGMAARAFDLYADHLERNVGAHAVHDAIYVASSWKNEEQPRVVEALRADGFDVYDFRNDESGFRWVDVAGPKPWSAETLTQALLHPMAARAFSSDFGGMLRAAACVLVLPCGKSAHLEAGWFAGQSRPLVVYMPEASEPELMYRLAPQLRVVSSLADIGPALRAVLKREESGR